uniref:CC_3452 family protein n=1 Tax=uncultured Sphingomonas sp. TaxID=158754 RepID=UPI0035CB36E2
MIRLLSLAAVASAALLAPFAATAAETSGYYAATPVTAPAKTMLITNGTVWKWTATAFTANKGPQRDGIVCEMIAQRAGKLSSFTAAGQPLDADALAKCNARAK